MDINTIKIIRSKVNNKGIENIKVQNDKTKDIKGIKNCCIKLVDYMSF